MERPLANFEIDAHREGTAFSVSVTPRSSRTSLAAESGGLRVRLAAPPVDGAANEELKRFLSRLFDVSKSDVIILSGRKSRNKRLLIRGMAPDKVRMVLEGAL